MPSPQNGSAPVVPSVVMSPVVGSVVIAAEALLVEVPSAVVGSVVVDAAVVVGSGSGVLVDMAVVDVEPPEVSVVDVVTPLSPHAASRISAPSVRFMVSFAIPSISIGRCSHGQA
jgi:hypothetical protein